MAALEAANRDHAVAYGDDPWTRRASDRIREVLGTEGPVFFVYNGTGANVVSVATLGRPYQAVICAQGAHLDVDECGAPERIAGGKLLPVPCPHGKLSPESVATKLVGIGDPHHIQPALLSITQANELGQIYSLDELRTLCDFAHDNGLKVHMDGARLANAAAALGCELRAITTDVGVDVLSFGGTKNGMMFGEAVVFLDPELGAEAPFFRKQAAQLASKMRFIAAQFEAWLENDLWRRNAEHSNARARELVEGARKLGVEITQPVGANAVFARLEPRVAAALRRDYFFYDWDASHHEVRWMTSFDTTEEDIAGFLAALERALEG
jgi:threonine aldolase